MLLPPFRRLAGLGLCLCLVAGLLAGAGVPAAQAGIVNGDFSQGLTGWTADPAANVAVVGGMAVLTESDDPFVSEVDLYQDFVIPVGATTLRFTFVTLTDEDDPPPDAFGASLLDPVSLTSLVPTVDSSTDSFYIRDLVPGVDHGDAAPGVTLSSNPDGLPRIPLIVTLDITGLEGQTARLLFRLIGGGLSAGASATIDDVQTIGGAAIPEPSSLTLLVSGLAGAALAGESLRRSRTSLR